MKEKQVVSTLVSICFGSPRLGYTKKQNTEWNPRLLIQKYAQFWFFKKCLGLVSPPCFVHDFSRKKFHMLDSINWPNFILWFPLLLEISGNMCTVINCYPVCDVINFEIYLSFLIKSFSYMTKNSEQKRKFLKNKRGFKVK